MGKKYRFKQGEKMKKIAIIGHFGGNEHFVDGQTVKTQILYEELKKATDWKLLKVDTYYKSHNKRKLIIDLCKAFFQTRDIIILLSTNGMSFFFPKLSKLSKLFGYRIYHDVIGGNLAQYVKDNPQYKDYLNSFRVNWVETNLLKQELEECGVKNAKVLVNFRRREFVKYEISAQSYEEPFSFCTFSRVSKAKGIIDAIEAIDAINADSGRMVCKLDIYGPVDDDFKEEFDRIKKALPNGVRYCGTVDSEKAVETLKNYYATLFPTRWKGESNAGTVTESQFAGNPVIATDWRCNKEMIKSGVNGVIYPGKEAEDLKSAILWLISKNNRIYDFRKAAFAASKRYLPDENIARIVAFIEKSSRK